MDASDFAQANNSLKLGKSEGNAGLSSVHEQPFINASDVAQAINSLKLGKSDGNAGLSSDHFKHSCDELVGYLSLLLTVTA